MPQDKATFRDLAERHVRGFASASNEAWQRDPICTGCETAWPCDTRAALDMAETARGDVHHHVNPAIGILRYDVEQVTGVDPLVIPYLADGLPDLTGLAASVSVATSTLVSVLNHMKRATDAADAALGEEPMRIQIERVRAEIAAQQTQAQSQSQEKTP